MKSLPLFLKILDNDDKFRVIIIFFLILFVTLFELLSIASVIPFVTLIIAPEKLNDYSFLENVANFFQSNDYNNQVFYFCIGFIFIFLLKNFFIFIANKYIYTFVFNFRSKIYKKLINNYLHQRFTFFLKRPMYEIVNNLNIETNQIAHQFARPFLYILTEIIVFFSILILMIYFGQYKIVMIGFLLVLIIAVFLKFINKKIKKSSLIRIAQSENIVKATQELIHGIKELILNSNPQKVITKLVDSQNLLKKVDVKVSILRLVPKSILEILVITIFVITVYYLVKLNVNADQIFVTLSFYLAASYRMLPSLNTIFVNYQSLKFGQPSLSKIVKDLSLKKELEYFDKKVDFKDKIEMRNCNFGFYKNKNILSDINFNLCKNDCVGIYGDSGSGKSTFLNILCGLLIPEEGEYYLDGNKISEPKQIRSLQNNMSYASQDSYLINGSIEDNIILNSKDKINYDQIQYALNSVNLTTYIDKLEDGLQTQINSITKNLSSGQKQRLILARLFYQSNDIIIVDEATNALDEKNEIRILNNLFNLKSKTKTIIIVSHNLNNFKNCNKIYCFKNGKIFQEK